MASNAIVPASVLLTCSANFRKRRSLRLRVDVPHILSALELHPHQSMDPASLPSRGWGNRHSGGPNSEGTA